MSKGKLLDLSAGGCCIEAEAPINAPLGSRVKVDLSVMGTRIHVAGVLCYVRNHQVAGVQFAGVGVREAYQIQELVDALFEEAEKDPSAWN